LDHLPQPTTTYHSLASNTIAATPYASQTTSLMASSRNNLRKNNPNNKENKDYGVVSQRESGAQDRYACNMDEQTLNRDCLLQPRLEKFFDMHAPHYKSRIPFIIDAYREWPLLLFGDLDHNYNTSASTQIEKRAWREEGVERKRVRVQVAQDYIYSSMQEHDYVHPTEVDKFSQAKLGTSKINSDSTNQVGNPNREGRDRVERVRTVADNASTKTKKLASSLSSIRRSVTLPHFPRKQRMAAPKVVQTSRRP